VNVYTSNRTNQDYRAPRWLRRAGKLGFAFFFVKGMAWMVLPLAVWLMD